VEDARGRQANAPAMNSKIEKKLKKIVVNFKKCLKCMRIFITKLHCGSRGKKAKIKAPKCV
jgi:hypothetical protein